MDRLDAMQILLSVVREGSISGGARRLRAPLATVSRKVSDLEQLLGTQLLVRTSRRVELTEAGRAYVAAAESILEQVHEAELIASGEYREPRGELLMTAPVSMGHRYILPIVLEFLKEYPKIDIRLQFSDARINLMEDQIHVGLRVGELDDLTLKATKVGSIRLATFASPRYLDQVQVPHHPSDLQDLNGITSVGWRFQHNGEDVFANPNSRIDVNSQSAAIEAARAGLGIGRAVFQDVEAMMESGELVEVLEEFALPAVPVHLIFVDQRIIPLKLRAFLDFAAPRLRDALRDEGPRTSAGLVLIERSLPAS